MDRNSSAKTIAEDEDLALATVYNLMNKISGGTMDDDIIRKKGRPIQEFSIIKNKISQIVLKDASFTQKEISEELQQFEIHRSSSTVSRTLKKMDYSRKRLVSIPEARHTPKNIDARQNYARQIQFISNNNLVFLDETGLNLHQTRNYGYSPKNMKAYAIVKGSRGANISCMVVIKNTGIVAYEMKDGAFEGKSFIEFIVNKLSPHFSANPNDVLVMDNCSFHHRKDVINFLNVNNVNYRFLPPYSPQLSPIEEYFSHFKAVLASIHPRPGNRDVLKDRIRRTLDNDQIDFSCWYNNMRKYVEKALARHDFI